MCVGVCVSLCRWGCVCVMCECVLVCVLACVDRDVCLLVCSSSEAAQNRNTQSIKYRQFLWAGPIWWQKMTVLK